MNINRKPENSKSFVCPKGFEKVNFSHKRLSLPKFQIWNLEISFFFEKTKSVPPTSFRVKATVHWMHVFVNFTYHTMNKYQWKYQWTLIRLEDFREPLLSFQQIHFRNYFCYRIVTNWNSKYDILSPVDPLRKNLTFSSPSWDSWNYRNVETSVNIQVVLLKNLWNNLNNASTANVREAMKYYNLGDRNFETNFSNFSLLTGCQVLLWNKPIKSRWNQSVQLDTTTGLKISIDFGPEKIWQCVSNLH